MFNRLLLLLRRIWSIKIIRGITYVLITFVFYNIIGGVIGNTAYNGAFPTWFKIKFGQLADFVIINLLIIIACIAVSSLIGLCYLWYKNRNLRTAFAVTDSLSETDSSVMRLLSSIMYGYGSKSKQNFQKEAKRLLHELLRDATRTVVKDKKFGRAAIFLPGSPPRDQYLQIIANHNIPQNTVARSKFYIGQDIDKEAERGTVGVTYLDGLQQLNNPMQAIRIGHITYKNGFRECDDEFFIDFDESRVQLPYNTFANIPIIGLTKDGKESCLGVLCFDSKISGAFDMPRIKPLFNEIAIRVGAVLSIYMEVVRSQHQSESYFDNI